MRRTACLLGLVAAGAAAAAEEPDRRIFYVDTEATALVELRPPSFSSVRVTALPAAAVAAPEGLHVAPDGRAVYLPPFQGPLGRREPPRAWIWDGRAARSVGLPGVPDGNRIWLDAAGPRLYWQENVHGYRDREREAGDVGEVLEVRTTFRIHATTLAGTGDEIVFTHELPDCACETGACDETCPVGVIAHPWDVIGETLLLNHWIAGQLGDTTESTWLLTRKGAAFAARRLDRTYDTVLDASPDAAVVVAAEPDDGCCAQMNGSNDRTLLFTPEGATVVFDERAQLGNEGYNVSVFTPEAALSPRLDAVAMVLQIYPGGEEQWGPYDADDDPAERKRLAALRARMPVVQVAGAKGIEARKEIDGADLVGWLDGHRLVLHRGDRLVLHDLREDEELVLPPEVRSAHHAFVR